MWIRKTDSFSFNTSSFFGAGGRAENSRPRSHPIDWQFSSSSFFFNPFVTCTRLSVTPRAFLTDRIQWAVLILIAWRHVKRTPGRTAVYIFMVKDDVFSSSAFYGPPCLACAIIDSTLFAVSRNASGRSGKSIVMWAESLLNADCGSFLFLNDNSSSFIPIDDVNDLNALRVSTRTFSILRTSVAVAGRRRFSAALECSGNSRPIFPWLSLRWKRIYI